MNNLIENPAGLDAAIQAIQKDLENKLAWLTVCYGKATRNSKPGEGNKTIYYPEVFKNDGGQDYINVMPDDQFKTSQAFFKLDGGGTANDWQPRQANSYTYPVSLIFWFNLEAIDPAKKHRFTEDLKQDVLKVLANSISASGYQVKKIYDNVADVWKDYSILNMESRQFRQPYGGFRIEGNLTFTEVC